MVPSKHFGHRQQQRGITNEQVKAVIAEGLLIGDDIYWMPCFISPRDDLNNLVVIAAEATLITTYRASRNDQRRLSRMARSRGVS